MKKVTNLTHSISKDIIDRLFISMASRYGNAWTNRHKTDEHWIECAKIWLNDLSEFDLITLRKAVAQCFVAYTDYPPTLGQLVDICLKLSGVPSEEDVIALMTRRDFNHPLVKFVYDKVGHWALSNNSEKDIRIRVKAHYGECLNKFRENPPEAWRTLKAHQDQKVLEAPEVPKIPTNQERISFAERMKSHLEKVEQEKSQSNNSNIPEFDPEAINCTGRNFDPKIFAEYRKFLLSVPERESYKLPSKYAYDRIKFIYAIKVEEHLKEVGYNHNQGSYEKHQQKDNVKQYKNWMGENR